MVFFTSKCIKSIQLSLYASSLSGEKEHHLQIIFFKIIFILLFANFFFSEALGWSKKSFVRKFENYTNWKCCCKSPRPLALLINRAYVLNNFIKNEHFTMIYLAQKFSWSMGQSFLVELAKWQAWSSIHSGRVWHWQEWMRH